MKEEKQNGIKKESSLDKTQEDKKSQENELEKCEKQKQEYLDGWKRARADFLNYRKEEMERIGSLVEYSKEEMILKILPILDSFDVAQREIPDDLKKDKKIEGFSKIKEQFLGFLKKEGLEPIDALGKKFDPNFHESIGEIGPSEALAKGAKSETIAEETQKGYMFCGKVIRPSKVKIIK